MIAEETCRGDLKLLINRSLFELVADYLGADDRIAAALFLAKLPLGKVLRLERLAGEDSELAAELLARYAAK